MLYTGLCHNHFLCSSWQSSHHSFEDEEYDEPRVFTCTLLYSCSPRSTAADYPIVTNSGDRFCLPDPFKRRPCSACPAHRRYCHGRCVYNNSPAAKCLFGTCSCSPYKETPGSTCSQLAIEAQEEECSGECEDISTSAGASSCQHCLVNTIDESCQLLSGASCWYCGGSVLEEWRQCSSSDLSSVAMIDCISQNIVPSCRICVCTLLCYWAPTGDLCTSCLNQPQHASLFLHHHLCPQGWVYSETSHTCFKAFNHEKPWTYAKSFC